MSQADKTNDATTAKATAKPKSKSKFSSSSSKFLAATSPTNGSSISDNNDDLNNSNDDTMYNPEPHEAAPNTYFTESDGRDINVLSNHQLPLQYRWTLWHTAPKNTNHKSGGWTTNYKQIAPFDTVGTFWQLFNNIAPPTMLRPGSSYHLFKGKVKPEWEDKFNQGGGSWTYRFSDFGNKKDKYNKGGRNNRNNRDRDRNDRDRDNSDGANIVNYAWYYTVLNMIGNNFDYSNNICGIVISIRKGGRGKIELWLKEAKDKQSTHSIGMQFKSFSGAKKTNSIITFISHDDNKKGNRNRGYDL